MSGVWGQRPRDPLISLWLPTSHSVWFVVGGSGGLLSVSVTLVQSKVVIRTFFPTPPLPLQPVTDVYKALAGADVKSP